MTLRKSMKGMESFWMCGLQGKKDQRVARRERINVRLTYLRLYSTVNTMYILLTNS